MGYQMKWKDSVSSKCRWSQLFAEELARRGFGGVDDLEVVWENSVEDYQGHANVVGVSKVTGWWFYATWNYGSCSGCDPWEGKNLSVVRAAVKNQVETFIEKSIFVSFLRRVDPDAVEAVRKYRHRK